MGFLISPNLGSFQPLFLQIFLLPPFLTLLLQGLPLLWVCGYAWWYACLSQVCEALFIVLHYFSFYSSGWTISIDVSSSTLTFSCTWSNLLLSFSSEFLFRYTSTKLYSSISSTWWDIILVFSFYFLHMVSFSFFITFTIADLKFIRPTTGLPSGTVPIDYFFPPFYEQLFSYLFSCLIIICWKLNISNIIMW